eukprot:c9591_g1_i1 orf=92-640(+)
MGAAAAEPVSPPLASPRLRRQRTIASAIASRCCSTVCCYDCDNFFTRLPAPSSSSSRDFVSPALQQKQHGGWHDSWRLLGSRRSKTAVSGPGAHDETEAVLSDDLYTKPTRWRLFFRKLRAETRKMNCAKPSPPGFHYDALSYAMNFDDGTWQQQPQGLYRSSSTAFRETSPSSKISVSSVS